jgi:mono/diheme cytochrome c family protein
MSATEEHEMKPLYTAPLLGAALVAAAQTPPPSHDVQRGRYLVQIAGCNDCHTPGFAENAGHVDEKLWLTGDALGWRGAWGTTYPANLRLSVQQLPEDAWMRRARSELRPPMPCFNLRAMSDDDLRSIYRYLKHAGPAGERAPDYVPPDREPKTPVVAFPAPPK